ncbi:hypothetical protein CDCE8392_2114 [Corynebacterium diphtheriae CDCE 8392]|nr:hypothetical protein CDCE8392_2114 [Corynebacterium diphtheriae CDCE 8392]
MLRRKTTHSILLVARASKSAMWSFLATLVYDAEHS